MHGEALNFSKELLSLPQLCHLGTFIPPQCSRLFTSNPVIDYTIPALSNSGHLRLLHG